MYKVYTYKLNGNSMMQYITTEKGDVIYSNLHETTWKRSKPGDITLMFGDPCLTITDNIKTEKLLEYIFLDNV